jgi:hypothetical protein
MSNKKLLKEEIDNLNQSLSEAFDPDDIDSILNDFSRKIKYAITQMQGITPQNKFEFVKKEVTRFQDACKRYISTH